MSGLNNFFDANDISSTNRDITIRYLRSMRRSKIKDSTIRNNTDTFKVVLKNIRTDLDKLTRDDVIEYCDKLLDMNIAQSTEKGYRIGLHRFLSRYTEGLTEEQIEFRAKIARELKTENKVATESRSYKAILTKKEIDEMTGATQSDRDAAIVSVMYESGARIGEIVNCNIKDVEFNNDGYKITLRGKTGTRKNQCVESTHELSSWLAHHPLKSDGNAPLFVTSMRISKEPGRLPQTYNRLDKLGIREVILKATTEAGITKHVFPHLLRHSRATHLAAKGLNEPILRNFFGWSKSSTVPSLYIHLSGVNTDDAILNIHGLSNKKDEHNDEMERCPRCKTAVKNVDLRCYKCNFALNAETEQIDLVVKQALTNYFIQHQGDQGELLQTLLTPKSQK